MSLNQHILHGQVCACLGFDPKPVVETAMHDGSAWVERQLRRPQSRQLQFLKKIGASKHQDQSRKERHKLYMREYRGSQLRYQSRPELDKYRHNPKLYHRNYTRLIHGRPLTED